jgi:DNA-directed RNA polymerase specialized sigma24 family protein
LHRGDRDALGSLGEGDADVADRSRRDLLAGLQVRQEWLDRSGRNGEADVLCVGDAGRVDADELAGAVDERTTGVAVVDRRICLDEAPQGDRWALLEGAVEGRDDAGGDRRSIAEIEGVPVGTVGSRLRRAREEFSAIAKRLRATWLAPRRTP